MDKMKSSINNAQEIRTPTFTKNVLNKDVIKKINPKSLTSSIRSKKSEKNE